jgi:hypothetical protein
MVPMQFFQEMVDQAAVETVPHLEMEQLTVRVRMSPLLHLLEPTV